MSTFVAGKNYDDYLADEMLQAAVQMTLHRSASALSKVAAYDPSMIEVLPEIQPFIDLGDSVLRNYRNPNHRRHFNIASRVAPDLAPRLQAILDTVPI
jgi:hypothetical protein